jgi:hypothetical protein
MNQKVFGGLTLLFGFSMVLFSFSLIEDDNLYTISKETPDQTTSDHKMANYGLLLCGTILSATGLLQIIKNPAWLRRNQNAPHRHETLKITHPQEYLILELEKLNKLRNMGVINEKEYEKQRRRLRWNRKFSDT